MLETNSGEGLIVNTSNVSVGTTHRYESYNDGGYLYAYLQAELTNVTLTIYATADNDAVLDANKRWTSIMESFGLTNLTTSGELDFDEPRAYGRIRITMEATNATNTCKIRMNKTR